MNGPAAVPMLQISHLTVLRAGRAALNDVSVEFQSGAWIAIVGPNGAGKSTLLAVLAGLLTPARGAVYLDGRPIADWTSRERARRVGWLGQSALPDADIAAHEVVRLGRLPHVGILGTPMRADEAAVAAALAECETTAFAHRRINTLSAGERQRVLLARTFAGGAPVLLLDEPTIHLDAPHQRGLSRSLRARARGGAVVLSVLHDLTLALAADRLVVLADGKLHADGPPSDAGVRAVLTSVFDHAFTIERLERHGEARWAAVPEL